MTLSLKETIRRLIDLRHSESTRDHEILAAIDDLERAAIACTAEPILYANAAEIADMTRPGVLAFREASPFFTVPLYPAAQENPGTVCANCLRPKREHNGKYCPSPYTTHWHAWDYKEPPPGDKG